MVEDFDANEGYGCYQVRRGRNPLQKITRRLQRAMQRLDNINQYSQPLNYETTSHRQFLTWSLRTRNRRCWVQSAQSRTRRRHRKRGFARTCDGWHWECCGAGSLPIYNADLRHDQSFVWMAYLSDRHLLAIVPASAAYWTSRGKHLTPMSSVPMKAKRAFVRVLQKPRKMDRCSLWTCDNR